MKRKITPIIIISVIFGLLFDLFFYHETPGISVFLYSLFILGSVIYLSNLFRARLPLSVYLLMPIIILFGAFVFIRASGTLIFFDIVLIFYLLLLTLRLKQQPDGELTSYTIGQYFSSIPALPFRFFKEAGTETRTLSVHREDKPQRLSYGPVLRGMLISLPILIVFILLLSSADMVFHKYITSVFGLHIHLDGNFVAQLILALIVATAFIGAFTIFFIRPKDETRQKDKLNRFELGNIEASIVFGSVEVLFLLFLLVQAAYFFGGAHHVLTTDFTYADYARRGFFELITVAAISLLLIWWLKQSTRLHTARQTTNFKIFTVILIVEVMIIMLSAHMRLNLYESTYGLTESRLLAHMFIYWLAVAFILFAVYIIRAEGEHQFAFRLFLSVLAFFAILNIINPDALIARHNIARMQTTGKIDTSALAYLSEDATPALATLLTSNATDTYTHHKVSDIISDQLYKQKVTLECRGSHWQSANLARMHAQDVLNANSTLLAASSQDNIHCVDGQLRY